MNIAKNLASEYQKKIESQNPQAEAWNFEGAFLAGYQEGQKRSSLDMPHDDMILSIIQLAQRDDLPIEIFENEETLVNYIKNLLYQDSVMSVYRHLNHYRLPTENEINELTKKCTWEFQGGGYRVTGPSGKSIYLPMDKVILPGLDILDGEYCYDSELSDKDKQFYIRLVGDSGVDLGLSVRWLDCNEGAVKPEEPGNKYTYSEALKICG